MDLCDRRNVEDEAAYNRGGGRYPAQNGAANAIHQLNGLDHLNFRGCAASTLTKSNSSQGKHPNFHMTAPN